MKKYILLIIMLFPFLVFSQTQSSYDSVIKTDPIINLQEGIEGLMQKNLEINKSTDGIEGYCVQLYSGNDRGKAQSLKYKFMKKFPEITSVTYERINPNWKVRAGKFRTKLEAEKLKSIISEEFPGCYISKIIVTIGEFD
ncbi:MAG: SPOR domain-containing protein [Flavobacteriales bacterium]|nr:SPOR domain-containing protein [Flavobacteriales bacterium]